MSNIYPPALELLAQHVAPLKTQSLSVMMTMFWWRNLLSAVCTASNSAAWLVWPNRGDARVSKQLLLLWAPFPFGNEVELGKINAGARIASGLTEYR